MNIDQHILGFSPAGEAVILYEMTNGSGARIRVINTGAALVSVEVPDKTGKLLDVVLGYQMFDTYINDSASMGKSIGRYANRIAKGKFSLNGETYQLAVNNGVNHLHGGPSGFQSKIWTSRVETDRVVFSYISPNGEEGYPGELGVEAVYDWSDDNELEISYYAKGDSDTIVNLTNHAYFNLNGDGNGDILSHSLLLNASHYLPCDNTQIPTGTIAPVQNTPMDFTSAKTVGKDINADFEQLKIGNGYDHCWTIDGWEKGKICPVGELQGDRSGIVMSILSSQPGVQIYTGNSLQGNGHSKTGKIYENRDGIAIECQNFPDSPNKKNFPSPVLMKDEIYEEHIIYKFSVQKD